MSALQAAGVRDHGQHDLLHEGRSGAVDEFQLCGQRAPTPPLSILVVQAVPIGGTRAKSKGGGRPVGVPPKSETPN